MKKKKNRKKIVALSAAVLSLSGAPGDAMAQLTVVCTNRFYAGQHAACGNGSLTVQPDSGTNLNGCLISISPPEVARCKVSALALPSRNVVVNFTAPNFTINGGGSSAIVDRLRMEPTSGGGSQLQYTLTPTAVLNTVTLNVAGRVKFDNNQPGGTYTGQISIKAQLQ